VKAAGGFVSGNVPALVERSVANAKGEPTQERVLTVDRAYVERQVASIVKNQDLSRYIL
jgi:ATP-dependent protease HslVU (ClpYQ) ATPase subunit